MVFCNRNSKKNTKSYCCHNPYFNRWFSAINEIVYIGQTIIVTILILIDGFLQLQAKFMIQKIKNVTILILIDGFLQFA